ncbi:MAG: hypothetical protein A3H98_05735 [Bacteroidetes bacterium RIFCSPLOWO2_02_FULL_36_8]|nr:MAG: hypothetical protein A3H98_05735 [Bacteroidetes bacterium RIFCSPLOWO2_02_FULL_36_8]OFY70101.1 MAG: hypothetical protein A3G23_11720 [Bacteroidetes bacterium RIFCSPLOWO2_12_FULL_37_12]
MIFSKIVTILKKERKFSIKRCYIFCFVISILFICCQPPIIKSNKNKKNKNGDKTGLWIETIDSVNVLICKYKNGLKTGQATIFYKSGAYSRLTFKNGKKNSKMKNYSNNNILCSEINYSDDKIIEHKTYCSPIF